jgi:hypothetical protein
MVLFDGGFGILLVALWLFCLIDVITTPESQIRNLPKLVWLMIVLFLPDIGSIAWLVAGRSWEGRRNQPTTRLQRDYPEYDRPGRYTATNPEDDEEFLRNLRKRADEQRRAADEQRKANENPISPDEPATG